jgi:N-acetylglucosaminyldiphosphoundecaprenol N-acetyl-beta-D-mannosaminyltransferase
LAEAAAREGKRLFLLGGEDDTAAVAAERLMARYPTLDVSVFEPPRASLEEMDDAKILRLIGEADPHILLVAFGHPKQDKWIYRHRHALPMVALGVGCSLDLIAGRHSRAPRWMQTAGLEWTYRLANEPRRLGRRYAIDALWLVRDLAPWIVFQ